MRRNRSNRPNSPDDGQFSAGVYPCETTMKQLLLLGHRNKPGVQDAIEDIKPWLRDRADFEVDLDIGHRAEPGEFDLAVVFGGDGSMLRAARTLADARVPILGINLGKFGFLTEGTAEEARDVLDDVLEDRCKIVERMMLQCRLLRDGECIEKSVGLNDVVVSPSAMSRLIDIDFHVNDQLVTTYRADGLIVSTPVGSTGHSLSAGGPIVYPGMDCFVVAPICPHTLTNRPLILPPDTEMKFAMEQSAEHPAVTVDGQTTMELQQGDRVTVRKADRPLRLVRTDRRTFFETLHNKLGWGGQPAYVK